jgi:hypothetical protein
VFIIGPKVIIYYIITIIIIFGIYKWSRLGIAYKEVKKNNSARSDYENLFNALDSVGFYNDLILMPFKIQDIRKETLIYLQVIKIKKGFY